MAVRGQRATNVGGRIKPAKKIAKVRQQLSPQYISNFKNKLTVASQKAEQIGLAKHTRGPLVRKGVSVSVSTNIYNPKVKVSGKSKKARLRKETVRKLGGKK